MKIIAGRHRGRKLVVPKGIRPSSGRLREALFGIWSERVVGASVLDLFAGSGAVGLEALSRGARTVVFVELAGKRLSDLRQNCDELGEGRARVVVGALPASLERQLPESTFDLVFGDPPYDWKDWRGLLCGVAPLVTAGGQVALEHSSRTPLPKEVPGLVAGSRRRYGESELTFFERQESSPRTPIPGD